MNPGNSRPFALLIAAALLAALPVSGFSAWQMVTEEQGRRVEIDRDSVQGTGSERLVKSRIVLDRPIVDPRTSASYRTIEIENNYDCTERTHATVRRTYFREDDSVLRQEEVRNPVEMPIRSGTPDDRILRDVCRPTKSEVASSINQTLDRVNEAAADLRKSNDAMVDEAVKKDLSQLGRLLSGKKDVTGTVAVRARPTTRRGASGAGAGGTSGTAKAGETARHAAHSAAHDWGYEGDAGPARWASLSPDFALCANGRRQSPIDIVDTFAVDLPPIQFSYPSAPFSVADTGHYLKITVYGGGFELLGEAYRLDSLHFHNPSEFSVAGKSYDMEAHLVHRAADGKLAVVSVLFQQGAENPVVQAALNNLPLEKGGEAVSGLTIDLAQLLPARQGYFTFMGSLTTPPCTEDVLWMVLKTPQEASAEQLSMFHRLYPPNARPRQPSFGRIIKESR